MLKRIILLLAILSSFTGCTSKEDKAVLQQVSSSYKDMGIITESISAMELAASFPRGAYWRNMSTDNALREADRLGAKMDAGVAAKKRIMESMAEIEVAVNDETWGGSPELRDSVLKLTSISSSRLETESRLRSAMYKFKEFLVSNGVDVEG